MGTKGRDIVMRQPDCHLLVASRTRPQPTSPARCTTRRVQTLSAQRAPIPAATTFSTASSRSDWDSQAFRDLPETAELEARQARI